MAEISAGQTVSCCVKCRGLFVNSDEFYQHKLLCDGAAPAHVPILVSEEGTVTQGTDNEIRNAQYVTKTNVNEACDTQDVTIANEICDTQKSAEEVGQSERDDNSMKIGECIDNVENLSTNSATMNHGLFGTGEPVHVEMIQIMEGPIDTSNSEIQIIQGPIDTSNSEMIQIIQGPVDLCAENGEMMTLYVDGIVNESVDELETVEVTIDEEKTEDDEQVAGEVKLMDHETRIKRSQTRYVARHESPKESDYTVSVEQWRETYHCRFCDYTSRHLHMLGRHLSTHNKNGEPFICETCGFKCMFRGLYQAHLKKHNRRYQCEHCSYRSSNARDLERHNLRHSGTLPFPCQFCDQRFRQKTNYEIHVRKHVGDVYKCAEDGCDYETPNAQSLKSHRQRKHGVDNNQLYQCHCGFKTRDKTSFSFHQKSHLGIKDHKCPHCDYRAVKAVEVKRHMKRHLDNKYYSCNQCSYKTAHGSALRNHLMCHEGLKSFSCSLCGYDSTTKSRLQNHIENVHPRETAQIVFDGRRLKIDLEKFRSADSTSVEDKVVRLRYGREERNEITVNGDNEVERIRVVTALVVQGSEEEGAVATFQCGECKFTCFTSSALASHRIQYHEGGGGRGR